METTQFNIRVSKKIVQDLAFIEKQTGISKSDWVRYNLSEMVRREKNALISQLEENFRKGRMSKEETKRQLGFVPQNTSQSPKEARDAGLQKGVHIIRALEEPDIIRVSDYSGKCRIKGKKILLQPCKQQGIAEISKNVLSHLNLKEGEVISIEKNLDHYIVKAKGHVWWAYP